MKIRYSFSAAIFCAALLQGSAAWGYGAMAVGQPASVSQDGVALGYTWNYKTQGEASVAAMNQCLSPGNAPPSTRALCKIVFTFTNQCLAVTMDANAGTDGFGWAVEPAQADATSKAMQQCRDLDGPQHAGDCAIVEENCDHTD